MSRPEVSVLRDGVILPFPRPEIKSAVLEHLVSLDFAVQYKPHLTVASAEFMQGLPDEEHATLYRQVLGAVATSDFRLQETLYQVEKPKHVGGSEIPRRSIVALLADRSLILSRIQAACNDVGLERPPILPHVTLLTSPNTEVGRRGIGISDADEWRRLQPRIIAEAWQAN